MRELMRFLQANPQAAILLAICLVLGLGTLVAVLVALLSSGATPAPSHVAAGTLALIQALSW